MSGIRHEPTARTVAWELRGGDTIDRHRHDDHQLVYVSAGVLEVQTAAGSWVVSQDRAVWLPAGTWHEHRFYGASRFYTVGFPKGTSIRMGLEPALIAVSPLLRELVIAYTNPALRRGERRRMQTVIGDQLKRSSQRPMSLPTPRDARLVNACELVADQLDEQISLVRLAGLVGTSESTLSRLFRQELGMTFPQWRTNARLLKATILLSAGTPVTDTATQCGWQTASSFIDTFRRALGQTPGAYRSALSFPPVEAPG